MLAIDTRPENWREWEQLGHAIAARAIADYATARKRISKNEGKGWDRFDPTLEINVYRKFFRSKYFSIICPKYDGGELLKALEDGAWKKVPRMYRKSQSKEDA